MLRFCFELNFNLNVGRGNIATKCSLSGEYIFQFCIGVYRVRAKGELRERKISLPPSYIGLL
jgi:hypothetical protein